MRAATLAFLSLLPFAAPSSQEPPSKRDIEKLVDAYVDLEDITDAGHAARLEILGKLELAPFPDRASDLKRWAKRMDKRRAKGRKLEKKSGRKWYWEKEERGLFYVGGETKKPKGLFIGLHGGGAGSGDASGPHSSFGSPIKKYDWVGIFPQVLEKTEHGWTDAGTEEWILQLIDDALRTWDIDPQNVFMGGHSMGGYGTWTLGAHHADRFAALVASAGAPTPITGPSGKYEDIVEGVVPCLRNVPLLVYQSIDDPNVPPEANQMAVAKVEEAKETWGGYESFEYWEVDGRGHGWPPGGVPALLEKIGSNVRDAYPEKIVWQPVKSWKRQFYWLYWEKPKPRSIVVAQLDRANNAIDIELTGAKGTGLRVLLSDAIVDMEREVTVRVGGETVFVGKPVKSFATYLMTAAGGDAQRTYAASVPLVP
ncbi:MAG: hypothetical protein GY711_20860 [bacterium]|nr:hypothetical protein [bacterium]